MAERTEKVYDFAMDEPSPNMMSRVKTSFAWGPVIGLWALFYTIIEGLVIMLTEFFCPLDNIDIVRTFDQTLYNKQPESYGDHMLYVDSADKRSKTRVEQKIIDQQFVSPSSFRPVDHKVRYATKRPFVMPNGDLHSQPISS